jgi:hypothetical protein
LARFGAGAGGSVLVALSLMAFVSPTPLPTISPAVPVPSPSIAVVQNLLNPPSGQPSGSGSPAAGQAPASAAPKAASNAGQGALTTAGPSTGVPGVTAPGSRGERLAPEAAAAHASRPLAFAPRTGGDLTPPGAPPPLAPGALAGFLLLLLFFGVRMTGRPRVARRYRVRVGFSAPGAPDGSAAAAVRCLLLSELPEDVRVREDGSGAFIVEAPMLHRAVLATRLTEVAARARRVGLALEMSSGELARDQADREPVVALRAYRLQGG